MHIPTAEIQSGTLNVDSSATENGPQNCHSVLFETFPDYNFPAVFRKLLSPFPNNKTICGPFIPGK